MDNKPSLPSRERGLKSYGLLSNYRMGESLPSRERGLKLLYRFALFPRGTSLPSRERGLKYDGREMVLACTSRSLHGSVD